MARDGDTEMGGSRARLPTTQWDDLAATRGRTDDLPGDVVTSLIKRYWKPIYCYVRRKGYGNEDAKDLVQEFFSSCLAREFFGKADPARGRFRAFLLSSLDNFLKNAKRAAHAKRRRPPEGLIALDELMPEEDLAFEPADEETPEGTFNRVWVAELLNHVLTALEKEYEAAGRTGEYELFRKRVIDPALEGGIPPSLHDLAPALGLTDKQAANRLVTARRAYERLLRNEIAAYAQSKADVTVEIIELFRYAAKD